MSLQVAIKKKFENFNLDVTFETEEGVFAILGASGCGKSMTLKCIAGIETPDEGRIILNGRVLFDSEKKINLVPQKRKVGYMFQDYALFPNMTVEQNIMAGMGKKRKKDDISDYIDQFHLNGLEKHYPAQLSGGQKQRVAMARMLAAEPDVLLLDEPFSALDSYLKWELEQQMRETLQKIGKPVLFVSHNRDEVYRLCNTVSCITEGKLEVIEPVKEFFQNPKTRTAAVLSGCKNISKAKRINEHQIEAVDWGVTLQCGETIPTNITYVGIRAHYFERRQKAGVNTFPVAEYRILEDLFEWNISFRTGSKSAWIQWKIAKEDWNMENDTIPEYLGIASDSLLLLRGKK